MIADRTFYLCLTCFEASEARLECHGHPMVECEPGELGDERRRPEMDSAGRLKSRAPRWALAALRATRAAPPAPATSN